MNQEMHEKIIDVLTKSEARDLENLESVIQSSLNEMESAGKALIEIRDRKLYRAEFGTFKEYVSQKWKMSWVRAYQLCDSVTVVENIQKSKPMVNFPVPTNERQTRELAKLEPEEQVQVWTEAVKTGNTSAKGIAETVEVFLPERCKKSVSEKLEDHGVKILCPNCDEEYSGRHKCEKEPTDEDSPGLWNLKHRWRKANKQERLDFLAWVEASGFKPTKGK